VKVLQCGYLTVCMVRDCTGPITLIILFSVLHFNFLFVPCGRLSWLPVSFLLHVKTHTIVLYSYLFSFYFFNLQYFVVLDDEKKNSLNSLTDGVVLTQNDLKAQFTMQFS